MKNLALTIVPMILLLALAAPVATAFQGGNPGPAGCPNTMASQVDAEVKWSKRVRRCGIGIGIFGLRLSVFGPDCPEMKFIVPAHQTCQGNTNEGTYCAPQRPIDILAEKCTCVTVTALGTGILIPDCECKPSQLDAGTVEDFETRPC